MSSVYVVALLVTALGSATCLLGAVFWRGRRKKSLGCSVLLLLAAIGSGAAFTYAMEGEAIEAGFKGYVDRGHAKEAGYTDPEAWAEVRDQFEAEREVAFQAQLAARVAEKARAAGLEAAAASAPTAEEVECRKDLICWGEKQLVWAGFKCPPEIERLATYEATWTDSWTELKFYHYAWPDKERGTLTMVGDALEFENGFRAKTNMIYECDIDPIAELVLEVRAFPGRL